MKHLHYIVLILFLLSTTNVVSQTAYITKTGQKYHKANCKYLKYSKKEIKIDRAIFLGYKACKVCKPTHKNTKVSNSVDETISSKPTHKKAVSEKRSAAVQCSGKTKSGRRCKRKTKNSSGRCWQH